MDSSNRISLTLEMLATPSVAIVPYANLPSTFFLVLAGKVPIRVNDTTPVHFGTAREVSIQFDN